MNIYYLPLKSFHLDTLVLDKQFLTTIIHCFSYETENGISAAQQGAPKQFEKSVGIVAQGSYQYSAPDGSDIRVEYVADENGYQPSGNVLPVPPPIPKAILRLLEYIATHPQPVEKPEKP